MKNSIFRAVATLAATATILVPISASSQTVGVTTAVRNTVQVRQTAAAQAKPAIVKQRVALGNQVDTGAQSAMQVTLLDKSTFTVGPNAKFAITSFVYDPARKRSSVASSVAKGTFRMLSGKAARGGANTISTPAATIGIRGTMVEGSVGDDAMLIAQSQPGFAGVAGSDPSTATLIVLRGPGPNAQAGEKPGEIEVTAGGRSVILTQPGMAVYVPFAGAPPTGPFPLSPNGFAFFDAVLRTAPQSFAGTLASLQSIAAGAGSATSGSLANASATASGATGGAGGAAAGAAAGGAGAGASSIALALLGALGLAGLVVGVSGGEDAPVSP